MLLYPNQFSQLTYWNWFMTHIIFGNRIGKQGILRLGCSAVLFDNLRKQILLTRREDNAMWCLPGGMIEPGESVAEACEREFLEETGLDVKVKHLIGIYSDPHRLTVYPDGNMATVVVLSFEVQLIRGKLRLSDETSGVDWFPISEALKMDLFHGHANHIRDASAGQAKAFIR
jgi:8-oxo-dGTP pyrophosphatase MutT (NUDIX family)